MARIFRLSFPLFLCSEDYTDVLSKSRTYVVVLWRARAAVRQEIQYLLKNKKREKHTTDHVSFLTSSNRQTSRSVSHIPYQSRNASSNSTCCGTALWGVGVPSDMTIEVALCCGIRLAPLDIWSFTRTAVGSRDWSGVDAACSESLRTCMWVAVVVVAISS